MELDFNKVPEKTNDKPDYLKYGIHDVTISGLIEQHPDGKTPYIECTILNDLGQHTEYMHISQAAMPYTMEKLQKISLAAGIAKDQISACKKVEQLDKLIAGKKVRIKLAGEEVEGQNGRFVKTKFAFGKFVVPVGTGGLKFTENSKGEKGDIKWLDGDATIKAKGTKDDLPF